MSILPQYPVFIEPISLPSTYNITSKKFPFSLLCSSSPPLTKYYPPFLQSDFFLVFSAVWFSFLFFFLRFSSPMLTKLITSQHIFILFLLYSSSPPQSEYLYLSFSNYLNISQLLCSPCSSWEKFAERDQKRRIKEIHSLAHIATLIILMYKIQWEMGMDKNRYLEIFLTKNKGEPFSGEQWH